MCIDETPYLAEITWISIHSLPFPHTMKRWDYSNMFHLLTTRNYVDLEIILKLMVPARQVDIFDQILAIFRAVLWGFHQNVY